MTEHLTSSTFETAHNTERTEEELRELGDACLATTVDASVLGEHSILLKNPNDFKGSSMFANGEIPTEEDKVYRQVHIEAVEDLAATGIVRNGATASGSESQRWGHRVFWNSGKVGTAVNTGGRAVIVASKEAAAKGWVTTPDIHAIHVKTPEGKLIDILDRTDS
ncbi:MAG: hypothetical protein JWO61_74 [Candidatus Saccharibacteria bacterium]|nr:hypothetical protein [Candidatus Saccharibacteria bacterium]